jgi:peptidyl-prolyl cis-trans isomerase SurA
MMKTTLLSLIFIGTSTLLFSQKDPVVMTVNNEKITKSEFLSVYLKNNNDPRYDQASLDSYIDLYKRFKLKVAEAKLLGYDTVPELTKELEGYRKQLARPYMVDSVKNQALVREAYERSQFEVRTSHILIKLAEDANPGDTLAAWRQIMALKKRIESGEDFGDVAAGKNGSQDPSAAQNRGDLGYFTAFQMLYPFETVAYETPVGKVGGPVRTKYGYHIIQVNDKRPARGTITAAHIMIAVAQDGDPDDVANAEKKIQEIHEKLNNGEDFANLVRMYSDDTGSKGKGGRLPQFGTGTNQRMVAEFEDAAFGLQEDGAYSEPFRTAYGFHIVKRLDFTPLGTYEEMYKGLQSKVNRGERGQKTQESFIQNLKKENKFKENRKHLNWFYDQVDQEIFNKAWERQDIRKPKVLFQYNKQKFTQNDFKRYIENTQRKMRAVDLENHINELYKNWVNQTILDIEESQLESKHPEFRALMKEYHDGVLLYEIMKDKVWDAAIRDTVGLQSFFQANQSNYIWPNRVEADVYIANERSYAEAAYLELAKNPGAERKSIVEAINETSQLNLKAENSKYPIEDTPFLSGRELSEGVNDIIEHDSKYYIVVVKNFLPSQPKSLAEARGAAIQDYQNHLEETWLEELRQRHIITVQSEVLYSLGN